jgi:hypothetical protein
MSDNRDSNYISVKGWMWIMFVTAIPLVGFIMMIVWCFTGDNESRKNYFRAIFAWIFLFIALIVILGLVGHLPIAWKGFQNHPQTTHSL